MCKIISLRSRNQLGGNDYKKNDKIANRHGEYIGMLPLAGLMEIPFFR